MKKVRFDETKNVVHIFNVGDTVKKNDHGREKQKNRLPLKIICISLICIFLILFLVFRKIVFGILFLVTLIIGVYIQNL